MKTLHLCSIFGDAFFQNFIKSINENNESEVFYPRKNGYTYNNNQAFVHSLELYNGIDRYLYYTKQKKCINEIERYYKLNEFSIIHAHTLYTDGYQAYILNKKYNIPYIVTVRSTDINYFYKYRKDLYFIARNIIKNSKGIVFLSKSYLTRTEKLFNINLKSKSNIITNGIDDFFISNIYNKPKYNDNTKTILTVGYISKRKNQLKICKAINKLNKRGYSIKYVIIGKSLDKKILRKILKYSFVEYKEFMDKNTLIKEYRKADIFAMASLHETFGLTYLEALSQNTPVLYTKSEGFDQLFNDGEVGYSVNPLSTLDISEKIEKILQEKYRYDQVYLKVQQFEWQDIGRKYKLLYQNLGQAHDR
ncbi:glycosyltransferase family 4 protein [Staphylococcus saprophyticus]|uniref:Putative glycosyl transferase n=3 Tax=Staphylococcus saprophyticus TaxID=29385 RepID=Q4A116_STAS1|nr:glycosyltransferase family 4 protein [Staphylococcus saprophyticus]ASF19229.1 glycosyl transferase [Staphylococcus saprophyticus]MDW3917503.1 glycosyltransferase family 4 protein [Staphylococcus saprophyticus]OOC96835.1 glycosyl transferase [Staphylococcus saprophyticus subsp. saprophyticus ATCC 15305 = NCTC 7292]QCY41415.1 glycosyltransferase [Staphylococcus saprophyticus subsp. saprophyticus ATCC 15305 = NCTC 7292]SUM64557.1 glycosyl transferase [Staphylococcus saprophyticus]